VNTHLFRDCVATTIAYDDPAHIRVCARVLGHSRFSTTEGHDNVAKTVSAADHYHDLIEAIRSPRPQVRAPVTPFGLDEMTGPLARDFIDLARPIARQASARSHLEQATECDWCVA
jgi:hypothetical protein